MAEDSSAQPQTPPQVIPPFDLNKEPITYQTPDLPILNADMVTFTVNQAGLLKLNFARLDNDIYGRAAQLKPVPVAQVVMPVGTLIVLAAISEFQLQVALKAGVLSVDHIQKIRDAVEAPLKAYLQKQQQEKS